MTPRDTVLQNGVFTFSEILLGVTFSCCFWELHSHRCPWAPFFLISPLGSGDRVLPMAPRDSNFTIALGGSIFKFSEMLLGVAFLHCCWGLHFHCRLWALLFRIFSLVSRDRLFSMAPGDSTIPVPSGMPLSCFPKCCWV
jgi:hypothetical protein